jgi:iron complex outermembrane receptor protein
VLSFSLGADTRLTLEGEYQAVGEIYWTGLPAEGTICKNPNGKIPISRYLGDAELERNDCPERTLAKLGYRLEHRFMVVFTVGLAPTLLAVTGTTIWWRKWRARRRLARASAAVI